MEAAGCGQTTEAEAKPPARTPGPARAEVNLVDRQKDQIFTPYSDIVLEATAAVRGEAQTEIPGVRSEEAPFDHGKVTRIHVFSPEGERAIGKQMGHYVTVEAPGMRRRNRDLQEAVGRVLVDELARMLNLREDSSVLVVGLGNWNATPDALGPRVVNKLLVTRHLHQFVPEEIAGGLRPVSAIAPGVLGLTGIETAEIIYGLVQHIRPEVVIAIDALAARSVERIGTTIQLADTGISPGSGLGNQRKGLNRQTLGVPVIAMGVPTVVHATTIIYDAVTALANHYAGKRPFFGFVNDPAEMRETMEEVLSPTVGDLVVTPKEIDEMIEDMSKVIAGSLNAVLHTSVQARDLFKHLH